MAIIVLVHLGFFWALTQGRAIIVEIAPPVIVKFLPTPTRPIPPPPQLPPLNPIQRTAFVPTVLPPVLPPVDGATAPRVPSDPPVVPPVVIEGPGSGPMIIEPAVDARFPLTEPEYPAAEIRPQHEGTVWLSVQILPNGHVGAVRLDKSSGYTRLDDSAMREARRWRMKPGTQDGVATAMWKRVPITFRLKD